MSHSHDHSNGISHSHDHHANGAVEHGHTHEILDGPGSYLHRELPIVAGRNWYEKAFTIGIGGPVGSGKTALMLELCRALRQHYNIAAVTNDIFTQEDAEYLTTNKALTADRIRAIQTGGCPHAAIREDISENQRCLEELQAKFTCDLLLIESGGDNLAANYSRELADYIIYVIDVAGGDKVPRKGGPGTTGSDLLVINKCDLAGAVGADLKMMEEQAKMMREGGPVVMAVVKDTKPRAKGYERSVEAIVDLIISAWKSSEAYGISVERWKNGAPRESRPFPED